MAPGLRKDERGVVIILMVAVIAALAIMATVFVVVAREESSAARNSLAATQASQIARAGLQHAIGQIEYCAKKLDDGDWLAVTPDGVLDNADAFIPAVGATDPHPDWGWHRYFAGDSSDEIISWVNHYNDEIFSKSKTGSGGRAAYPPNMYSRWIDFPKDAPDNTGRYAVCVVDLDGRLNTSLGRYDDDIQGDLDDIKACLNRWQTGDSVADSPAGNAGTLADAAQMYSLGELSPLLELVDLDDADDWLAGLTCYPIPDADPPTTPVPAVNINTARSAVLKAILLKVPSLELEDRVDILAKIIAKRPFADRAALETAIAELAPAPVGDDTLEEIEFNDLLNSLNNDEGSIFASDGDHGTTTEGTSGIYKIKFNLPGDRPPDTVQDTGSATESADDVTWCTTVKFRSRFFQVYIRAEVISPEDGTTVLATRALQAVYDSTDDKIRYFRWEDPERPMWP